MTFQCQIFQISKSKYQKLIFQLQSPTVYFLNQSNIKILLQNILLSMDVQRNRSSSAQSKRSLQDKNQPSNQLYVCFLPQDITEEQLREVFGECGELQRVSLKKKQDGFTFCYVHYRTIEDAEKAVNKLNRKKMGEKCINVKFAAPFVKNNEGDKKGNGKYQKNSYQGKKNSEQQAKKRFQGRQDKYNDKSNRNFNNRDNEKKPFNNKFDRQGDKYNNTEKKFPETKAPSKNPSFAEQDY